MKNKGKSKQRGKYLRRLDKEMKGKKYMQEKHELQVSIINGVKFKNKEICFMKPNAIFQLMISTH